MFQKRWPTSVGDAHRLMRHNSIQVLLLFLLALFWLVVLCVSGPGLIYEYSMMQVRVAHYKWKHAPHKLPTRRQRALTIPIRHPTTLSWFPRVKQESLQQTESYLGSKLPIEIRRRIFELVVCGDSKVLHIFRDEKKMKSWRCSKPINGQPCSWTHPCSLALRCNGDEGVNDRTAAPRLGNGAAYPKWELCETENVVKWGIMGLLCSSREVYSEVVELLYTKSHFHFADPSHVPTFAGAVLPSRLASIQHLYLDGGYSKYFAETYGGLSDNQVSKAIGSMHGLKGFRIFIKSNRMGRDAKARKEREDLRENFRDLKGLPVFEVVVPRGMAASWEGFWEEKTEGRLVVGEDMGEIVPDHNKYGIVCVHPGFIPRWKDILAWE